MSHARTEAARFLGYEIVTLDADEKHDLRGHRCINGAPGLKVPVDVIRTKCSRYMQRGEPVMVQREMKFRGLGNKEY